MIKYQYVGDTYEFGILKPFPIWVVKGDVYESPEPGVVVDGNGDRRRIPTNLLIEVKND